MYLRVVSRKNRDGSKVRYVQLCHNVWTAKGYSQAKVLYNFGREDAVDKDALRRLVRSICRFLEPEEAAEIELRLQGTGLRMLSCRALGGTWLLDRLWRRIGIDRELQRLMGGRRIREEVERLIFALVANRALSPSSKLSATEWMAEEVVVPGFDPKPLPAEKEDRLREEKRRANPLYEAMDFLLEADAKIQEAVFSATARLLELEVDVVFLDTTATYFEVEAEDEEGIRRFGHSKDHRPDLPQVVIGLAVTKRGIPVRCWVWPGNRADVSVVEEVRRDLLGWRLGRVITVIDRGFTSEENLKTLGRGGGHFIAGVRMRSGRADTEAALSRPGRYRKVRENLEVKEVVVGDGEARRRYILVKNPKEAERDREVRASILKELESELERVNRMAKDGHTKAVCALLSHEVYGRYLRQTKSGRLAIDRVKVAAEERYDGRYLLLTSDDTLSAEDVALGYKQLADIECAFRTLKTTLSLRPVYHRLEERIRAHVLLCWLALLLVRVTEAETGETWSTVRREMERLRAVEYVGPGGHLYQTTELTPRQQGFLRSLQLDDPPKFLRLEASTAERS